MAKVSIIIPTQNSASYIDATCLSLFCQAEQDMEILFIDNASTDDTPDFLRRYALFDKRIQVHFLDKPTSLMECCRIGLEKVSTPYVMLMNGAKNSFLVQECLVRLLFVLDAQKGDFVYSPTNMFATLTFQGLPFNQIPLSEFQKVTQEGILTAKNMDPNIFFQMDLSPWGNLYRTEFLKRINFEKLEEPFFLECFFNAKRIAFCLDELYQQQMYIEDLSRPTIVQEQKRNRQILKKYHELKKYENAFICYKMNRIWNSVLYAKGEQQRQLFEEMKEEFTQEDFSRYDFEILRKHALYWHLREVANIDYDTYKTIYTEGRNA